MLMAEYLYNGLGYTERQAARVYDMLAAGLIDLSELTGAPAESGGTSGGGVGGSGGGALGAAALLGGAGERAPLGRHYLAGELSFEWYETLSATLSGLISLRDGSVAAGAEVTVVALRAIDMYARGGLVWGESRRTQFGIGGTMAEIALGARVNL
jgi:hypothetical protein